MRIAVHTSTCRKRKPIILQPKQELKWCTWDCSFKLGSCRFKLSIMRTLSKSYSYICQLSRIIRYQSNTILLSLNGAHFLCQLYKDLSILALLIDIHIENRIKSVFIYQGGRGFESPCNPPPNNLIGCANFSARYKEKLKNIGLYFQERIRNVEGFSQTCRMREREKK